jgi:putative hydrolase of the HAD superfamily
MKRSRPAGRSPRLRALFFDAGNTLLQINYADVSACLAGLGIPATPEAVARAEYRARVKLDPHLAPGASTEDRMVFRLYVGYLLEALGVTDDALVSDVYQWVREYNPPVGLWNQPDSTAPSLLDRLKTEGYRLGVISNSNGSVRSILEETGLASRLDFILDSAVVGVEKPDPRIFRMALEEVKVSPKEAAYIGDLYSVDVLGSRRVGMTAVLLDPGGLWGHVDCPKAPTLGAAVDLALSGSE